MMYRMVVFDKAYHEVVIKIMTSEASKVLTELVPYLQKKYLIVIACEESDADELLPPVSR